MVVPNSAPSTIANMKADRLQRLAASLGLTLPPDKQLKADYQAAINALLLKNQEACTTCQTERCDPGLHMFAAELGPSPLVSPIGQTFPRTSATPPSMSFRRAALEVTDSIVAEDGEFRADLANIGTQVNDRSSDDDSGDEQLEDLDLRLSSLTTQAEVSKKSKETATVAAASRKESSASRLAKKTKRDAIKKKIADLEAQIAADNQAVAALNATPARRSGPMRAQSRSPNRRVPYSIPVSRSSMFADPTQPSEKGRASETPHYPPPEPPSGDLAAVLKYMVDQQVKSDNKFTALLEKLSVNPASVPIPGLPFGSTTSAAESQGRIRLDPCPNPKMAQMLGIQAAPKHSLVGNLADMNQLKIKNKLKSGRNRRERAIVREETWPHELLHKSYCREPPDDWKDATFLHFAAGTFNKALFEIPMDRIDRDLGNMLYFAAEICNLCCDRPWSVLRNEVGNWYDAIEMGQASWSDQESIVDFIRTAKINSLSYAGPRPAEPGAAPNSSQPQPDKAKKKKAAAGVPVKYLISESLCIKFNDTGCDFNEDHEIKGRSIAHICGGCLKKFGTRNPHPASKCKNQPFDSLF